MFIPYFIGVISSENVVKRGSLEKKIGVGHIVTVSVTLFCWGRGGHLSVSNFRKRGRGCQKKKERLGELTKFLSQIFAWRGLIMFLVKQDFVK